MGNIMNNLNKLINYYIPVTRVSTEDNGIITEDYINKLFDEINNPTELSDDRIDELFQEAIGISPKTATELINDVTNMNQYGNVSGRSNVKFYKYGDDWILVQFSEESYYLYTLKSIPVEQLTEMKYLADSGTGLNKYISKQIRINYAARHVKGELNIRPGMEHYELLISPKGGMAWLINSFKNGCRTNMNTAQVTLESYKEIVNKSGKDNLTKETKLVIKEGLRLIDKAIDYETSSLEDRETIESDLANDIDKRLDFVQNNTNG